LSFGSYRKKVEVLTGSLREEIKKYFGANGLDRFLTGLIEQAEEDASDGAGRPSAEVSSQAYNDLMAMLHPKGTVGYDEGEPSSKRTRMILDDVGNFTFDTEDPWIPCPSCGTSVSIRIIRCATCGTPLFKETTQSLKERKIAQGQIRKLQTSNRGPRSDVGSLKQALKGHRKYFEKTNLKTGEPFASLLERYDNDVFYRFRMLCNGWERDMIPGLQALLETPIGGGRRTREQIEEAQTSYVANPELSGTEVDDEWTWAEHARNPDWEQTKDVRNRFKEGLVAHSHRDDPVEPWVKDILEKRFNVPYVSVIAPESEEQSSASFAKGAKGGPSSSSSAAAADAWWQSNDAAEWWEASGSGASWQQWTDTSAWRESSGRGYNTWEKTKSDQDWWHYDAWHYKKGWW
jgi:hypothetical protein